MLMLIEDLLEDGNTFLNQLLQYDNTRDYKELLYVSFRMKFL